MILYRRSYKFTLFLLCFSLGQELKSSRLKSGLIIITRITHWGHVTTNLVVVLPRYWYEYDVSRSRGASGNARALTLSRGFYEQMPDVEDDPRHRREQRWRCPETTRDTQRRGATRERIGDARC